jgi:hypothetical protein
MFFRVIRKIIQRHFKYHLLIPLVVGLLIEFGAGFLERKYGGPVLKWVGPFAPILGFVGAYLVVMYFVFRSETNVGMKRIESTKLKEALKGATGYFAVGAIGLREWFEPSPQVYLATVMKRKLDDRNFRYDRVLLFSRAAYKDLDSFYLNGYYAKALTNIHDSHGIRLAYLTPEEIEVIMKDFSLVEGKAIGYYPRWLSERLLSRTPRSWRGIWTRKLALGVVEYADRSRVMPFSKHRMIVDIDESKPDARPAFDKLLTEIKKRVYNGSEIDAEHDFHNALI